MTSITSLKKYMNTLKRALSLKESLEICKKKVLTLFWRALSNAMLISLLKPWSMTSIIKVSKFHHLLSKTRERANSQVSNQVWLFKRLAACGISLKWLTKKACVASNKWVLLRMFAVLRKVHLQLNTKSILDSQKNMYLSAKLKKFSAKQSSLLWTLSFPLQISNLDNKITWMVSIRMAFLAKMNHLLRN